MERNSSHTATPESVWAYMEQSSRDFDRRMEESRLAAEKRDAEYRALMAQRDAEYKASAEKRDAEYKASAEKRDAEYKANAEKRDAAFDARMAKLDAKLDKVAAIVSGIGNNNGFFAEEYFFNAMKHKMMFAGIKYDHISNNLKGRVGRVEDEYDIVLFNGTSVAIIETKYRVHKTFVNDLTTKKVSNFRQLFPEYAQHKIYLGVASMSFNADTLDYAHELGIGIIKQNGDTFEFDTENMKAY